MNIEINNNINLIFAGWSKDLFDRFLLEIILKFMSI